MTTEQKYDQLNWASGYCRACPSMGLVMPEIKVRLLEEGICDEAIDLLPEGMVEVSALIPGGDW